MKGSTIDRIQKKNKKGDIGSIGLLVFDIRVIWIPQHSHGVNTTTINVEIFELRFRR